MKKNLGLTRSEVDPAIDRAIAACRIYKDRKTVWLCQTGVVNFQRLIRHGEGPTFPGQIGMAVRIAKSACRALSKDEFKARVCQRGVDLAVDEVRREAPGISGRKRRRRS